MPRAEKAPRHLFSERIKFDRGGNGELSLRRVLPEFCLNWQPIYQIITVSGKHGLQLTGGGIYVRKR